MAFNTTLKYYGTGSIENQYIVKINYNHPDFRLYKLDETEFLNKLTEIKTFFSPVQKN
jgi:hypothetical protein